MQLSNPAINHSACRIICTLLTVFALNAVFISVCWGEAKQLYPPKIESPPAIDGILDDQCWLNAAKGDNFELYDDKKEPEEQTEFFICYDDTSIYVAFHCFDSQPDKIIATQKERDGAISNDDYVYITLDTYHEHRQVERFYVNAIGTQRDFRTQSTAGKIEWKGDWRAAATTVEDGWSAEIEIPFSILSYNPNATSMGFNASRRQQRPEQSSTWIDANTLEDYGDLMDMELPAPQQPLKIMPYVLFDISEDNKKGRFGVDIKKNFGIDNTILFTAFPDFGSIESAVKSIDFSYTACRYGDNRPFFQEASSIFYSPYQYTTSIPDFDFGVKVFGKQGKMKYGLMRTEKEGDRSDSVVSAIYDLPSQSAVKFMLIGRDDDEVNNKVLSFTVDSNPTPSLSLWGSGAKSLTSGAEKNGSESDVGFYYSNSDLFISGSVNRISKYFDAASGFVNYPGSKSWSLGTGLYKDRPEKSLRDYSINFWLDRIWDKDHGLINSSVYLSSYFRYANDTSWSVSHNWGPHIANYDDEPGTEYYWYSDSTSSISFNFNTDDKYRSGGISYRWGNEAGGPSESIRFNCGFRPMKKISTDFTLQRAKRDNEEEGEIIKWLGIFGARYEISPEKSTSARLVYRKEGTNFTLSYRQQVRKGLDIYALYGDYNADKTKNQFSIKMVMAF